MAIIGPGFVRSVGDGERVRVDPSSFDGNLSPTDDTVQKALERLDDAMGSGGGLPVIRDNGNPNKTSEFGQFGQKYYDTDNGVFYLCTSYPSGTTWVVT